MPSAAEGALGGGPRGPSLTWTERVNFYVGSAVNRRRLRAVLHVSRTRPSQSADADPSGKKYCVPFTGWLSRSSNCCKSWFRSTKSISDVSITSTLLDLY